MLVKYGEDTDARFHGLASGQGTAGTAVDPTDGSSLAYTTVLHRDTLVRGIGAFSADPVGDGSVKWTLVVDGEDVNTLELLPGFTFINANDLNIIIPAGKCFSVRYDVVDAPVTDAWLYMLDTYFV